VFVKSVTVRRVVSELVTVRFSLPIAARVTVTVAVDALAENDAWPLMAAAKLVAVWLFELVDCH